MPRFLDPNDDVAAGGVALARDVAGALTSVVLTHYPDRDTLDLFRPDAADLATVQAGNRVVAVELARHGVEVFVQKADRAAFRRWMDGREDTPQTRRRWIDRGKLLWGAAAFALLGVDRPAAKPAPRFAAAPGPGADRLLAAFDAEESTDFDELAQALLAAGRGDILDLAVRKLSERQGDDAGDALLGELLVAAEAAALGPSGWAGLVAIPVALPASDVPDALAMGAGFLAAGILNETVEVRFLPGWRNPEALADLSPSAVRRVLLALIEGVEPRDCPPGDTDDLAEQGFGVLLGLQIDWDIPVWEAIVADGLPDDDAEDDEEGDETPEEKRRADLFDGWRGATFDRDQGCVPLALVPLSEVEAEIAAFLEEAGQQSTGIEEIREFVSVARREADSKEIFGRIERIGEGLQVSLFTESGAFLDSLDLPVERLPAGVEDTIRLIESLVRVNK